jgi:hypothetical protein
MNDIPRDPAREQSVPDPLDEPDFAEEHTSATFADQMPGGPEGASEPETPEGYAGMEPRGPDRPERDEPSATDDPDDR